MSAAHPEYVYDHWYLNQWRRDHELEELLPSRLGPDDVLDEERIEEELRHGGVGRLVGRRL